MFSIKELNKQKILFYVWNNAYTCTDRLTSKSIAIELGMKVKFVHFTLQDNKLLTVLVKHNKLLRG